MFHGYRGPNNNPPHMDATFIMELSSRDFPYRTFFTGLSLQDFPYATFQIAVNAKSVPVPVPVKKVIAGSPSETG
jgi:hypothetical protein